MNISDIGESVDTWKKIQVLEARIDNVKAGRIEVRVNGEGLGSEAAEAVSDALVAFLRTQRRELVGILKDKGFTE